MFTDIRTLTDPLPIIAAACLVDTAGLFVWRYTANRDGPINKWYNQFGLAAYGADVLSMIIGILLTQYVAIRIGGSWNPVLFCAIAVAIQMAHDIFFSSVIVPAVPIGHNAIMDLMREYATMEGAGYILLVDAIYMILTALIAMVLVKTGGGWPLLVVTLYATMYILYTGTKVDNGEGLIPSLVTVYNTV
jgi:hypothetical protein